MSRDENNRSSHSYTLLDFGDGQRLEQWGSYRLIRPDPTARSTRMNSPLWRLEDARYDGVKGKGKWILRHPLPEEWPVEFDDLRLIVKLAAYKHTGVFPEQLSNWRWMRKHASAAERPLTILNLFGYSGGATIALAKDGHFVTHVDASKPAIGWGKANAALNDLPGDRIRWILDDAPAFVARERRRGKHYDAIVLDPPAFGHSPTGKTWRLDRDLAPLLRDCCALLSTDAAFIVLNGYAQNDTPATFKRLLTDIIRERTSFRHFYVDARELSLLTGDGRSLSTGIVARCSFR